MNAREHAGEASSLLERLAALEGELAELDDARRLELIASGVMKRLSRDVEWTLQCAVGHALTAIALQTTQSHRLLRTIGLLRP